MFIPDIKYDDFYYEIINAVVIIQPKTIIEIGSANGLGSTQAFIEGMQKINNGCEMFCFEIDKDRHSELHKNTRRINGNYSIVTICQSPLPDSMDEDGIRKFFLENPGMNPARYGFDTVVGRLNEVRSKMNGKVCNGLENIKHKIKAPSVALVDGSPFSGRYETDWLIKEGVDVIMLDDIEDIKCRDAYLFLLNPDSGYVLVKENKYLRNGYAIFEKKPHSV